MGSDQKMGKRPRKPKPTEDGPVKEEKTKDPMGDCMKTGGWTAEILKKLQKHWFVLFVTSGLLLCATIAAVDYLLFSESEHMKAELQLKIKTLSATREENELLEEERRQLHLQVSRSRETVIQSSAERQNLTLQLEKLPEISAQRIERHRLLRSILHSDQVSFIWGFCDEATQHCSRCPTGWKEHNSRCFYLSPEETEWQRARMECRKYGGDLAVVSDAEDQAFLTNLTLDFVQQHPNITLQAAWIGLHDSFGEKHFRWIDGSELLKNETYWDTVPNDHIPVWDERLSGEDCVGIRPLKKTGPDRLKTWEDINCRGERNYICMTEVLIMP